MPVIDADDGSFSFEYEPGLTCTYWIYSPTIYIHFYDSHYFMEDEDGIDGFINLIMAEHLSYLKSIDRDLNADLIFAPTYIFDHIPGKWNRETLLQMLEQAVDCENYEKAQQIKNELDNLPL
jgi:hypothetical protein